MKIRYSCFVIYNFYWIWIWTGMWLIRSGWWCGWPRRMLQRTLISQRAGYRRLVAKRDGLPWETACLERRLAPYSELETVVGATRLVVASPYEPPSLPARCIRGEERRRREKILISNFQAISAKIHFILSFKFRIFTLKIRKPFLWFFSFEF